MKNQKAGFIIPALVAIVVLLAIGTGIYVYESKKTETPVTTTPTQVDQSNPQNTPSSNQTGQIVNSPANSNTVTPTIAWSTYSDSQYPFSFSYPSTFTTCKNGGACVQYIPDSQATFAVSINPSETYEDCTRILYPSSGSIVTATTSQTSTGGIVFEKDSTVDPAAGQRYGTESYRTYYNGACYEIDLHAFWTVQNESYPTTIYPILEALLPTFKFTAPQTVAPTHSALSTAPAWVTYNGSLVPVTFQYPGVLSVNTKDLGSSAGDLWLTQSDEKAGQQTVSGADLPGKIEVRDTTLNYPTLASAETDLQTHQYGYTSLTLGGQAAIRANTQSYDTSNRYYVAHNGKVYEIIIYDPLTSEVQNFLSSFAFTN